MLLLTDSPDEGRRFLDIFSREQACTMLAFERARERSSRHLMIACHVGREATLSSPLFGAALAHHRSDPNLPVLFVLHDRSDLALAAAGDFGAHVVPADAGQDELTAAFRRLRASYKDYVYGQSSRAAQMPREITAVVRGITEILKTAARNEAIAPVSIERSAGMLLASIKNADLGDWLDMVRRYDDITYQHCLIVSGLVAALSVRLGFALPKQLLLAQAALLHDIGKASIPREILNKPGTLTAAETATMRQHPVAGHTKLVRQRGIDPAILDIVRHHHELLDGSGYPDGLRQGQISEAVRLVTICDIYGALIERRAYKAPMSSKDALAILAGMGNKLDADLLQSFTAMVGDL